MKKKFLVLKVVASKTGKFYAVGRFASQTKSEWVQQKNGESWGDSMIEISQAQADKITPKILNAAIYDAEVTGFNDYNFPIYTLAV